MYVDIQETTKLLSLFISNFTLPENEKGSKNSLPTLLTQMNFKVIKNFHYSPQLPPSFFQNQLRRLNYQLYTYIPSPRSPHDRPTHNSAPKKSARPFFFLLPSRSTRFPRRGKTAPKIIASRRGSLDKWNAWNTGPSPHLSLSLSIYARLMSG